MKEALILIITTAVICSASWWWHEHNTKACYYAKGRHDHSLFVLYPDASGKYEPQEEIPLESDRRACWWIGEDLSASKDTR